MLKKTILFLFLVLLTKLSYPQSNLYSDSVKVTDSSILIATSTKYKQYEFCIEKKNDIIKELKKLTYGKVKENESEKFSVVIKLVTKGKIIKIWDASPISSIIEVEEKKYSFDVLLTFRLFLQPIAAVESINAVENVHSVIKVRLR